MEFKDIVIGKGCLIGLMDFEREIELIYGDLLEEKWEINILILMIFLIFWGIVFWFNLIVRG